MDAAMVSHVVHPCKPPISKCATAGLPKVRGTCQLVDYSPWEQLKTLCAAAAGLVALCACAYGTWLTAAWAGRALGALGAPLAAGMLAAWCAASCWDAGCQVDLRGCTASAKDLQGLIEKQPAALKAGRVEVS